MSAGAAHPSSPSIKLICLHCAGEVRCSRNGIDMPFFSVFKQLRTTDVRQPYIPRCVIQVCPV